jgi:hypothetical protein
MQGPPSRRSARHKTPNSFLNSHLRSAAPRLLSSSPLYQAPKKPISKPFSTHSDRPHREERRVPTTSCRVARTNSPWACSSRGPTNGCPRLFQPGVSIRSRYPTGSWTAPSGAKQSLPQVRRTWATRPGVFTTESADLLTARRSSAKTARLSDRAHSGATDPSPKRQRGANQRSLALPARKGGAWSRRVVSKTTTAPGDPQTCST